MEPFFDIYAARLFRRLSNYTVPMSSNLLKVTLLSNHRSAVSLFRNILNIIFSVFVFLYWWVGIWIVQYVCDAGPG